MLILVTGTLYSFFQLITILLFRLFTEISGNIFCAFKDADAKRKQTKKGERFKKYFSTLQI